jgi:hypothetical protein
MYQKQKGLAMNCENLAKFDVIEIKRFSLFSRNHGRGKKGGKIEAKFL